MAHLGAVSLSPEVCLARVEEAMNFEERRELQVKHREAVAEYLRSRQWDYFFTTTFRNERRNSMTVKRHVWNTLQNCNIGKAFVAVEPHKSCSGLHVHGLLSFAGNNTKLRPYLIWRNLFQEYGRSKVDYIRSSESVSGYCAKYVAKEAGWWDYDFFGKPIYWKW